MKSWTISRRISTGGILVLTTLAAVVAVSLLGLHTLNLRIKSLRDHVLPGVTAIGLANGHFMSCYSSLLVAREIRDNATRLKALDNADQHLAQAKSELTHYSAGIEDPKDHANFEELNRRLESYLKVRAEYCALLRRGELEAAGPFVAERLEPANATLREYFDTMLSWNAGEGRTETEGMSGVSKRMLSVEMALAAVGLVLCVGAGLIIVRSVKRALAKISGGLSDATLQISAAAGQIAAASETLAQGASEQAASLEETSASLEEMSSMTRQNSDSSRQAKELSAENRTSADRGATQMDQMRAAMSEIKASSHDIAKIIKTIDEIAFQTNILALNAAVEAARAGDAGMGFAVVAEEVRALAQRSAQSARETAAKIEDAISKSDHGVGISESVASVLHEIVEKTRRVDDFVASIAAASHEQSDGVSQLNKAVNQMDKVTQANAGSAEETASAAQGLTSQVDTLSTAVADLQELVGLSANRQLSAAKITPQGPPRSRTPGGRFDRATPKEVSSRRGDLEPAEALS